MHLEEGEQQRNARWLQVVGRLRAGTGIEQAAQEMRTLAAHLEQRFPDTNQGWTISIQPLHEAVSGHLSRPLWLLRGLVLAAGGLALGLPLSLALGSRLSEVLYQTRPSDALVLAATLAILTLSALLASLVPARRASRVDPSKLLRAE